MGPIVEECVRDYADKAVTFVTFDFTTEQSTAAAQTAAKQLGVEKLYAEHAPSTGYVLLYDARAGKLLTRLSAAQTSEQWHAAIDRGLSGG